MTPRYRPGDRVRVSDRDQEGHIRTPNYVRRQAGTVERFCGAFPNPEGLAAGTLGLPYVHLYRVAFPAREVWADYREANGDRLLVDLYEHWLEPWSSDHA